MRHLNLIIKKIVRDHHTVFFVGVVLIIMGIISLSENLFENLLGIKFKIAYGYLFLGIFNVVAAFAFIVMGTMNIEAGIEPETAQDEPDRFTSIEDRLARLEEIYKNEA